MSRIVDFYRGETLNSSGVGIETIWGWNDRQLEVVHTYIQWLFPLREPSQAVPGSPTIAEAEARVFRSLRLMLGFYGFVMSPAAALAGGVTITPASDYEAVEWFAALQRVYVANVDIIGRTTYEYWRDAVERG
jgi:hypothetical protein